MAGVEGDGAHANSLPEHRCWNLTKEKERDNERMENAPSQSHR
jgi:hypothetical protein